MEIAKREGREGSRWWNERPNSEAVADWFAKVPIHEELDRDRYLGGIVLIEQRLKMNEIAGFTNGRPNVVEDVQHITYTPYPKVETRVQYFWDLMAEHEEWLGVIEPVGGDPKFGPGFSFRTFPGTKNSKPVNYAFVVCSMQVTVFERESYEEKVVQVGHRGETKTIRTGKTIIKASSGTKMVPANNRYGDVDANVMMKAETGAVGRALGMAGMLVVPGAGVATAEDMHEAAAMEGVRPAEAPQGAETATLPQDGSPPETEAPAPQQEAQAEGGLEELRARCSNVIAELKEADEDAHTELLRWAKEDRGFESIGDLNETALKGVVRKAEKALDEVQDK